jgi:hypothetical protein
MKRLLNPLMARQVSQEEHLVAQVIMGRRKDAGTVQQEPVVEAPGRGQRAILEALEQLAAIRGGCRSRADVVDEGDCRRGESME